jgi:hypothetical protein
MKCRYAVSSQQCNKCMCATTATTIYEECWRGSHNAVRYEPRFGEWPLAQIEEG